MKKSDIMIQLLQCHPLNVKCYKNMKTFLNNSASISVVLLRIKNIVSVVLDNSFQNFVSKKMSDSSDPNANGFVSISHRIDTESRQQDALPDVVKYLRSLP